MSTTSEKANLARIRDNQRRSRARRKEYLQELEAKLRSCELQGIEASAEIQMAARRVADENKKLRALLARNGIGHESVEIYLTTSPGTEEMMSGHFGTLAGNSVQILEEALKPRKGCNTDASLYANPTMRNDRRDSSVSTMQSLWDSTSLPEGSRSSSMMHTAMTPTSMASRPSSIGHSSHPSLPHIQQRIVPYGQQQAPRNLSPTSSSSNQLLDYNTQFSSPQNSQYNMLQQSTAQKHLQPHNLPQRSSIYVQPETQNRNLNSCSLATDMITTMAGADPNNIRAELGCLADIDCDVDNQIIFDVMDRYTNGGGL